MKLKNFIAGVLTLAVIVTTLPQIYADRKAVFAEETTVVVDEEYSQTVSADSDYEYTELEDGTLRITRYKGEEENVVIPSEIDGKKVTEIGEHAFSDLTFLTSVTIQNDVTKIGNFAFAYCTSLTTIEISNSVKEISYYRVFERCTSLTSIKVDERNINYSSEDGILFNKDKTDLLTYPAGKTDKRYSIPSSVTHVSKYAFEYCVYLTTLEIPYNVAKIDDSFESCTSLSSINVNEKNTNYSSQKGVLFDKNKTNLITYPAGKKDKSYLIPNSVTQISGLAFYDCTAIMSVEIPNSVTTIGGSAFQHCESLISLNIPDSVTVIGNCAFSGCSSLTSIKISCNITKISSYMFSHCSSLISVEIPDSVVTIDDWAFSDCLSLSSIEIPFSVKWIEDHAFCRCQSLSFVEIPDSVTSIGYSAFVGCDSLKSVIIPENVIEIKLGTFSYCSDDLTIYGVCGSCAETYANENNINFNGIKSINSNGDNLGIEVFAPLSVPTSAVLSVKKILETDEGITYDISLTADGKNVNFNGEKAVVKIPIPEEVNKPEYKVYRKEANGKYTDMKTVVSGKYLVFFTDHFSEYVVTTKDLAPKGMLGDINNDTKVTIADARMLLQVASGSRELTDEQKAVADINDDGKITIVDARWLLQAASGSREL